MPNPYISPIDKSAASSLLSQSGLTVLEGVDPNQENHVAASIIQTQTQTIGVLLRLEPNIPVIHLFLLKLKSPKFCPLMPRF